MVEHATTYTVRKLLESLDVDHEDEEGGLDVVFDPNDVCEGDYCVGLTYFGVSPPQTIVSMLLCSCCCSFIFTC